MDTTPLETDLLRHRDFLLRLATGLVGGNDAEDLVQDVWTKAIEHRRESGTGAQGWLARVARNLAVNRFRARSRRERRERDSARPEGAFDSFEEVDERFALGQRVAAAVSALDEPHRAVILLRFFEGLAHAEIAARLDLPLATVRTRQQRALAKLRERLDRESGGRAAWSLALETWLAQQGVATVAASGAGAALGWGAAAILVLTLGGGVWWTLPQDESTAASTAAPEAASASAGANDTLSPEPAGGENRSVAETEPSVAGSAPQLFPALPARRILSGRVVGLSDGDALAARIRVDGLHRELVWPQELHATGPLDADGSFEVDLAPLYQGERELYEPHEFVVRAEHPRYVALEQRVLPERGVVDEHGDLRYTVEPVVVLPAAILRGSVEHDDGSPAGGARVLAFRLEAGRPRPESTASAVCASDGGFELRLAQASDYALAALQEGWRPATRVEAVVPGSEVELTPIRLDRGSSIAGRTLRLGQPEAGIDLYASPQRMRSAGIAIDHTNAAPPGFAVLWSSGRFEWSRLRAISGTDARFRLEGLAPVEYQLYASDRPGTRGSLGRRPTYLDVTAPAESVALEFDASLISLDVRGDADERATGRILVRGSGTGPATFSFRMHEGSATFVAPPNTPFSLQVDVDGMSSEKLEIVSPGPGEELRRTVVLTPVMPARLVLEPRGSEDHPIPGLRLGFFTPEEPETPDGYRAPIFERATDARPLSAAVEVPPGAYWVEAWVSDEAKRQRRSYYAPLQFALELTPGEARTLALDFVLGGLIRVDARTSVEERQRVQFRLLDVREEPVSVTFEVHHEVRGQSSSSWYLVPWAVNETERSLPPGDYVLVLWDDDLAEQRVPVSVVAGETTEVAVTLQPK